MSDELNHTHSNPETSFEREDLSTRGVFVFMIGLAITGIVIYFIIVGMYSFLDKYEHAQMSSASPLAPGADASSRYIVHNPAQGDYVTNKFQENGAPLLENDERGQFKDFLLKQEDQLNSYGWVDQQTGVAHIPIERAMDLIVERGLPVLPAHESETNTAAAKAPATNKAAAKK
ncbi:MAG: hypothetical protein WBS24_11260 [Terriglobales bacterium]